MAENYMYGFYNFKEIDLTRENFPKYYNTLKCFENLYLEGKKNIEGFSVKEFINDYNNKIKNVRDDLSNFTNQIIYDGLRDPDIKKSERKKLENEFKQTMDTYKEVVGLCKENISNLDKQINDLTDSIRNCQDPYVIGKLEQKIRLSKEFRARYAEDQAYFSSKIKENTYSFVLEGFKDKCKDQSLKPMFDKVMELEKNRERIYNEIGNLFDLEDKMTYLADIQNPNKMLIDDQKAKIVKCCFKMQKDTQEIIEHGMKNPAAKSDDFTLFYHEAQKTHKVFGDIKNIFSERILNYEKAVIEVHADKIPPDLKNRRINIMKGFKKNSVEFANALPEMSNEMKNRIDNAVYEKKANINSDHKKNNRSKSAPTMSL